MKKLSVMAVVALCFPALMAENIRLRDMRSSVNDVTLVCDGRVAHGGWHVAPEVSPDVFETMAREVKFVSDCDSLMMTLENEWDSRDFNIITAKGDTASVRVVRVAANPFENPSPEMRRVSPSGLLSREQAAFDIEAMFYVLSEVHPDIYSVCNQGDLLRAKNKAIASLGDSVSSVDLYRAAAPVVAMIGDGHTSLVFPYNSCFTKDLPRMPLYVDVMPDRTVKCASSLDSVIPRGARILSINGVASDVMIDSMLHYVSGEREHYRLHRVDNDFTALRHLLFPADSFVVEYRLADASEVRNITLPSVSYDEVKRRCPPTSRPKGRYEAYSYSVDEDNDVAVMDFRSFDDVDRMTAFADSMFSDLSRRGIGNLVIDLRNNGGGNSRVGDVLLRYITPIPYVQMEKVLVRITPLTVRLMGGGNMAPCVYYHEAKEDEYIRPLTAVEGHYDGKVYLLTSTTTFSSAGSFAWAFKECGIGTVIGEETGGMNVAYGDILSYRLPLSGLRCSVSFKRFWQFRADENDIHGTIPDVAVRADQALDRAFGIIKADKTK